MKIKRKIGNIISVLLICGSVFYPSIKVYAADGDNAEFNFEPLNGFPGENEVKIVVDTDNAAINHLIFDIVDTGGGNPLVFDITGDPSDPVIFVRDGQDVLGTHVDFTTASGDKGYDMSSANPFDTGVFTDLHAVTLIADRNLPNGAGGTLSFDTDTAIYVNTHRKGILGPDYTVLPNAAPVVTLPEVGGVDLSTSTAAPSAGDPFPAGLVQNVSPTATFTYTAEDTTDASVQRQMKVYKRLDDGSWGYPASPELTATLSRSGFDMDFSWTLSGSEALDFASYYKVEYIVTDDQTASNTSTFYFTTSADNVAPSQISKASMTFISESSTRTDVIGQISFTTSSDNGSVADYYLWTSAYLVAKDILNEDGSRDLALDANSDSTVSDEEFYVGLRDLVNNSNYLATITSAAAGSTPYFRITGDDVDSYDDNGTPADTSDDIYYVPESLAEDILYVVAADNAEQLDGTAVPNFSELKVVNKWGDVFGAEVTLSIGGTDYNYIVGDGSLDVWDAVYLYRNIIGLFSDYPTMSPDLIHSDPYNYPSNLSTSSTTTP